VAPAVRRSADRQTNGRFSRDGQSGLRRQLKPAWPLKPAEPAGGRFAGRSQHEVARRNRKQRRSVFEWGCGLLPSPWRQGAARCSVEPDAACQGGRAGRDGEDKTLSYYAVPEERWHRPLLLARIYFIRFKILMHQFGLAPK
jgi:hypothetical protein